MLNFHYWFGLVGEQKWLNTNSHNFPSKYFQHSFLLFLWRNNQLGNKIQGILETEPHHILTLHEFTPFKDIFSICNILFLKIILENTFSGRISETTASLDLTHYRCNLLDILFKLLYLKVQFCDYRFSGWVTAIQSLNRVSLSMSKIPLLSNYIFTHVWRWASSFSFSQWILAQLIFIFPVNQA